MIQKIREATGLLIRNLPLYGAIVLTIWLPASILLVYLRLHVFPETTNGSELQIFTQEFRVTNLIEIAFGPLYAGAVIHATAQLKQNYPASYGASMTYGAQQSFRLLGARIICGFVVLLGLLILIIPGIILALQFTFIEPIVVLERLNGFTAIQRSNQLTQGKKWQILGTMILTFCWIFLILTISSFALLLPPSLIGQEDNFFFAVLIECLSNLVSILFIIVPFLFYWEAKQAALADDAMPDQ